MKFDASKDVCLWKEEVDCGMFNFEVSVMRYNDGAAKVQISRKKFNEKGHTWSKLGRLTATELASIWPLLEKAKNEVAKHGNSDSMEMGGEDA